MDRRSDAQNEMIKAGKKWVKMNSTGSLIDFGRAVDVSIYPIIQSIASPILPFLQFDFYVLLVLYFGLYFITDI